MYNAVATDTAVATEIRAHPTWRGQLSICRFDHWVKNVFVLPGIVIGAAGLGHWGGLWSRAVLGLLSVGLISSSNYILNEILDAPFDRLHPKKRFRPIPAGEASLRLAYAQWLLFMAAGLGVACAVSGAFTATMAWLWLMGIVYNVRPLRTKDVPYVDVLSESINNPIRMLAGWYISANPGIPPASLLASYWMVGAYFMAVKRFAEYREIANPLLSAAYRRSFAHYNEPRLLVSIMFYAASAMLTFGAFLARYRLELILAFPFVALVMTVYLKLAFQPESAVQHPEYLYREFKLMTAVILCATILVALMFIDVPLLYVIFSTKYSGFAPQLH
jgi:decaprenyl-phosphate phosphoribosyltransferase